MGGLGGNAVSARDLHRETVAAKALKEALSAHAEDSQLLHDMIEGETELHEAIAAAELAIDEDQLLIDGIKAREADLKARRERFEARIRRGRAAIEQAMMIAEQKRLDLPTATIVLSERKPSLVVDDEAAIPSEFFEAPAPKLNRKALAAALDERDVPGAHLTNGPPTLTIRRK